MTYFILLSLKVFVISLILSGNFFKFAVSEESVHFLEPGTVIQNNEKVLQIYCHRAKSKYITNMWETLTMHLLTQTENYDLYDGIRPQEVIEKHEENQKLWRFSLWSGSKRNKELKIDPFQDICIGIYVHPSSQHKYSVGITLTHIDVQKVATMILGILLYWNGQKLSRNPLFYYICGITLGVTTSILILIYLISRLLPRGKMMYLMLGTGWTMSFYLAQALVENAQLIIVQYKNYVLWYILTTALISFLICYRFGPVTNPRTKNIIQWFLQILGLIMMFYSSHFREASFACCIVLILLYNIPIVMLIKGKQYWNSMFPVRRKLLSEDQYRKEGIKETQKALKELQEYCSSPECNPWRTVLRLKSPIRFAKFMEGDSHLSEEELCEHEVEITKIYDDYEYTDEEDSL